MPGWEGSDRRHRLPADWPARRRRVMKRDGYQCKVNLESGDRCTKVAVDVDHIAAGDNHDEKNLQAICGFHHGRKSGAEGAKARRAAIRRSARRFDRTEPHPGLR